MFNCYFLPLNKKQAKIATSGKLKKKQLKYVLINFAYVTKTNF